MAPKQKKSNMAQKLSIVAVSVLIVTIVIMSYKLCPSTSCVTGAAAGTYEYFFNDSQSQGDNGQGAGQGGQGGQGTGPSGATISATPTPEDPDLSAGYFCGNGLPEGPIDCDMSERCFYHANQEGEYECSDNACSSVFTTGPESWGANCWGIPWCCDSSGGLMSHGIHMGLYCQGLFGIAHPEYEYFNADCASSDLSWQNVLCPGFEMKGSAVTAADCVCAFPPCNTSDFDFTDKYFAGETAIPMLAGGRDIARDSAGNIYVLTQAGYNNITVYKYGSECDSVQVFQYNNATYDINATGIAIDGGKHILVSGTSYDLGGHNDPLADSDFDYFLLKFNPDGSVNGTATYAGGTLAVAMDVAVDFSDNVYVTGFNGTTAGTKILSIKYNPLLVLQWVNVYNGPGAFDMGRAITTDNDNFGNAYVAGGTGNSLDWADDSYNATVIKFSSAAAPLVMTTYAGVGYSDIFNGISVIRETNGINYASGTAAIYVYATGLTAVAPGTSDTNVLTVKYTDAGAQVYAKTYDGPATFAGRDWDQGNAIASDTAGVGHFGYNAAGNFYVAATVTAADGTTDWAILGYNKTGGLFWSDVMSLSAGNDEALGILASKLFVTGTVNGSRGFLGPMGEGHTLSYYTPSNAPTLDVAIFQRAGEFNNRHLSPKSGGARSNYEIALGTDTGAPTRITSDFGLPGKWTTSNHIKLVYDSNTNMMTSTTTASGTPFILSYQANPVTGKNYFQFDIRAAAISGTPTTNVSFRNVFLTTPSGGVESLGNFNSNPGGSGWIPQPCSGLYGCCDATYGCYQFWNVQGVNLDNGFTLEGDIVLSDLGTACSGSACEGGDESNRVNIAFGKYNLPHNDADSDGSLGLPAGYSGGAVVQSGWTEFKFLWDQRTDYPSDDCAPSNSGIHPGATESCDGVDDDCDTAIDECLGAETCGVGECERTVLLCENGQPQTCVPGTPTAEICNDGIDQDCDGGDLKPTAEICGDGIDQDCNGADLNCPPEEGGGGGTTVIIEAPVLGPPGDPVISTDREAVLTEPETILVFDSNGNPAEGFLVIKTPNGTSISVPIVDGKVQYTFDTTGTWSLEYTDPATSKTAINYIEVLAAPMQPQPPQPQPAEVPAPPAKPPVVKDDTMLMALLLGLLVIACIGAFLAYRKHKGKH